MEEKPEIVYLRLIDGTELIGHTFTRWDDDVYVISDARRVIDNWQIKYFMPGCSENLFTLKRRDVIIYTKPGETLVSLYKQNISRFA